MLINDSTIESIRKHSASTYPEECCGVLLGLFEDDLRVLKAIPVNNKSPEHRERHYTIDAPTLFRIIREGEAEGLDVVGFYHSHPDHPARPSQTDLDEATFPTYVYLIQSVIAGAPDELTAWRLAGDRSRFVEEAILASNVNTTNTRDS